MKTASAASPPNDVALLAEVDRLRAALSTATSDAAVWRAVKAYDAARCASHGPNEPRMSERNMQSMLPMIKAAIAAALEPQQ